MRWKYTLASGFHHLQPIYLVLLIAGGQVGLPLVIVTLLFSKKAIRHPILINFFCTWIIYSVVFCLLCVVFFWFATRITDVDPKFV